MKTLICSYLLGIITFTPALAQMNMRVTLEIVTPESAPIVSAKVGFGGGMSTPTNGPFPAHIKGLTDTNGQVSGVILSRYGEVDAFAEKVGYYPTEVHGMKLAPPIADAKMFFQKGRWEPWEHTVSLILKPIKNPVPMYVDWIDVLVPAVGKPVGYDLQKSDWVSPYGSGVIADLEFTVEGHYQSKLNYSGALTLRFPGAHNGIQAYDYSTNDIRSELKMPYEAPADGYVSSWTWRNARMTDTNAYATSRFVDESRPNRGYFIQVRTVVDATDRILRADYGKIEGPIHLQTFEKGQMRVRFTYYYNPDHTRNLEFDLKRNLLASPR